jgi:hypothetical protein
MPGSDQVDEQGYPRQFGVSGVSKEELVEHLSAHPLRLSEFRIHMEDGPKMRSLAVTADFWD